MTELPKPPETKLSVPARKTSAELKAENRFLREALTNQLKNPFIAVRENTRYRFARTLSGLLAGWAPKAAAKYARSAEKRDPQRFLTGDLHAEMMKHARRLHGKLFTDRSGEIAASGPINGHLPVVILPFEDAIAKLGDPPHLLIAASVANTGQFTFLADLLDRITIPFDLVVAAPDDLDTEVLRAAFVAGPASHVELVPFAAETSGMLGALRGLTQAVSDHELVLFLGPELGSDDAQPENPEPAFVLDAMIDTPGAISSILEAFAAAPDLGILTPPLPQDARVDLDWGADLPAAQAIARNFGTALSVDDPVIFPGGATFWARPAAIQPLLDALATIPSTDRDDTGPAARASSSAIAKTVLYACEAAGFRWLLATTPEHMIDGDVSLFIRTRDHLEWALSDQMPALRLPGTRPNVELFSTQEARLAKAKDRFRRHCADALDVFLESEERLSFPETPEIPQLSILLVLFNQAELTFHCLQSIRENAGIATEIVILDNGSSDRTTELLCRLDNVKIIENAENLHFLKGVNRAAQEATGKYLLLLNNDTRVLPGAIPAAISQLEADPSIGAVGGPIVLLDGTLQEAGSIIYADGSCQGYGRGRDPGEAEFRFRRDVDYCSGAFLMFSRDTWESLQGFDEDFAPAYFEETDFCMRLWDTNCRVIYEPDAKIVHFEFGSSAIKQSAIDLQIGNREKFVAKHATALKERHYPSSTPPIVARARRQSQPRLLVIDDRVPMPNLGSGYPRAACMIQDIGSSGWGATLYPAAMPFISCNKAYTVIPQTTELTVGAPVVGLKAFLAAHNGCFDAVLVSRPHNMAQFRAAVEALPDWQACPVLYDAEAIFAERDAALAKLSGDHDFDLQLARRSELSLAEGTRTIFSVSEAEAAIFRKYGHSDVRVLGHAIIPNPQGKGPEGRRDMLFVGALDDDNSPNADALIWFVESIMPHIDIMMGSDWRLHVAGRNGAASVQRLQSDRVRLLGKVDDLFPLYAAARVFIAPIRYAAGIPMKVHEAASVGLPTVVTSLLAGQLGWTHERELLSAGDLEGFAACCARLYCEDALWSALREGGLGAVKRDCAPERFRETVHDALNAALMM